MAQCQCDSIRTGIFCDVGHQCKEALWIGISHGNAVWHIGEHRQIVAAVAEGVGVGFIQMIIVEYILNAGCLGVAVRNKFAEISAALNAFKIAVADGEKVFKLRAVSNHIANLSDKKSGASRSVGIT